MRSPSAKTVGMASIIGITAIMSIYSLYLAIDALIQYAELRGVYSDSQCYVTSHSWGQGPCAGYDGLCFKPRWNVVYYISVDPQREADTVIDDHNLTISSTSSEETLRLVRGFIDASSFDAPAAAREVLDSYPVHQQYTCWYNSAEGKETLVFWSHPSMLYAEKAGINGAIAIVPLSMIACLLRLMTAPGRAARKKRAFEAKKTTVSEFFRILPLVHGCETVDLLERRALVPADLAYLIVLYAEGLHRAQLDSSPSLRAFLTSLPSEYDEKFVVRAWKQHRTHAVAEALTQCQIFEDFVFAEQLHGGGAEGGQNHDRLSPREFLLSAADINVRQPV